MSTPTPIPTPGPNPPPDPRVISFLWLRRLIGILGIIFPAVLLIGSAISGCNDIQDSISHYYFTTIGDLFVGTICAIAVFLIAYRGYDNDHLYTIAAGIFALGVAFFPTTVSDVCNAIECVRPTELYNKIHYISAALFFVDLAFISIFRFTKGDKNKAGKKAENIVYVTCGIIMVISVLTILILHMNDIPEKYPDLNLVFWLEWVALFAFGVSWLTKGKH